MVEVELVDVVPIVRSVNPAVKPVVGYESGTVIGSSLDEFVVPDQDNERGKRMNQRIEAGKAVQTEVRRQTATSYRHFLLRVVPYEETEAGVRCFAMHTVTMEQSRREQSLTDINRVLRHNLRNDLNASRATARTSRRPSRKMIWSRRWGSFGRRP